MGNVYLQRYAYPNQLIAETPDPDLELAIVIPCYNEPHLLDTLQSIHQCSLPPGGVEILVIINDSEQDSTSVRNQNQESLRAARRWTSQLDSKLKFFLQYENLPHKHAGVGLARKVGKDGILVCLDADCRVDPNYLESIFHHFKQFPQTPGCAIYFEHPLTGTHEPEIYQGIAAYELHLRYYTHALKYAGHPFAFQTVGSAMAVRSSAYQKQGGMNRRQAGEDFYFLQNIFLLGNFTEITNTRVIPSPRASSRVPFGTGKAIKSWLEQTSDTFLTYNYHTFNDLKHFIRLILESSDEEAGRVCQAVPPSMRSFIGKEVLINKLKEIRGQTTSHARFTKRFFNWCNGFFVFKYAHHARDQFYPNISVEEASSWLLKNNYGIEAPKQKLALLKQFRALDKQSTYGLSLQ